MREPYSFAKPQGFQSEPLEEVYEPTDSGSISAGPASRGFAMPVGLCSRPVTTDKSAADLVYGEQEKLNNDRKIGAIKNRETSWYEWLSWSSDPSKEDFAEVVRRDFAEKVVPYVRSTLTNWEGALNQFGTKPCRGPLVLEKVGLAMLLGRAGISIRNLEGAAAALIFLGSGSEKAEALTAEQLAALEHQLTRQSPGANPSGGPGKAR